MKRKFLSIVLSVAIIMSALSVVVHSTSGELNEYEYNNSPSTSNETFDDYNNYGSLAMYNDEDWWHITPTQTGLANIYLSVPSGCNYDLYVYNYDGTKLLASSTNTEYGQFELVRCHLKSGSTYKIKIISAELVANSSLYQMRVKIYTDTGSKLFNTFTNNSTFGELCMPALQGLGLFSSEYTNNYPQNVIEELPRSDVLILYSHNYSAGIIEMEADSNGKTYLTGINYSSMTTGSRSIASLASSSLSQTDLVIFGGSRTGKSGTIYGNLVDQTISKGAFCALGWTGDVDDIDMMYWLHTFINECNGQNAYDAAYDADLECLLHNYVKPASLQTRYWGTSNPQRLYLDIDQ